MVSTSCSVTHAQFNSHLVTLDGWHRYGTRWSGDVLTMRSVIDADFTNVISLEQFYFSADAMQPTMRKA